MLLVAPRTQAFVVETDLLIHMTVLLWRAESVDTTEITQDGFLRGNGEG